MKYILLRHSDTIFNDELKLTEGATLAIRGVGKAKYFLGYDKKRDVWKIIALEPHEPTDTGLFAGHAFNTPKEAAKFVLELPGKFELFLLETAEDHFFFATLEA